MTDKKDDNPLATDLSIKLQRTVSAAYHALLEMSAWMGIPEKKRHAQIEDLMSNVKYCAEHDLRHVDESQAVQELRIKLEQALRQMDYVASQLWLSEMASGRLNPRRLMKVLDDTVSELGPYTNFKGQKRHERTDETK